MAKRPRPTHPATPARQNTVERDVVVIGASAGGIGALQQLVHGLPGDFPASVFVVVHIPPEGSSSLPRILQRAGRLRAVHPTNNDRIERGVIYVAPPDQHLLVKRGKVRLAQGPKENGSRPAVDSLFRTAAVAYGPRVIGVILSGNLGDGASGLSAVKRRGGTAVVQDPVDAPYPGMPTSALEQVDDVDHVVRIDEMAALLDRLVREPLTPAGGFAMGDEMEHELDIAEMTDESVRHPDRPGIASGFGCPDCGGALFQLDADVVRFRCRVGHAWSGDALLGRQKEALETALWVALRALEEQQALAQQVSHRLSQRGNRNAAARFRMQATAAGERAIVIRDVLKLPRPSGAEDGSNLDAAAAGGGLSGPRRTEG